MKDLLVFLIKADPKYAKNYLGRGNACIMTSDPARATTSCAHWKSIPTTPLPKRLCSSCTGRSGCKNNPDYERGLSTLWISKFKEAYYNGVAVGIHGNHIESTYPDGTPRKPGDFAGVAPDPADPPLFESEPAYLDRLGLLTDDERDKRNPTDFESIPLPAEYWP